jgi:hypothetical protein
MLVILTFNQKIFIMSTNNDSRNSGQSDPGNSQQNQNQRNMQGNDRGQNMSGRDMDDENMQQDSGSQSDMQGSGRESMNSAARDTGDSKWNDSSDYSATSRGNSQGDSENMNDGRGR